MSRRVMVTGATGHLGANLVHLLVRKGYQVRAGVRHLIGDPRVRWLRGVGAEVVPFDLLRPKSMEDAMNGVDGVFHLAAAYSFTSKDPEREIVRPAVEGVEHVITAAAARKVPKVIFTSSTTAVGSDAPADRPLCEADWNLETREPYAHAKTQSELAAHRLARSLGINLVSMAPAAILGPGFFRHTPSTLPVELALRGRLKAAAPLNFSFVDARDVAEAHLAAFERDVAGERYILSAHYASMSELFGEIAACRPSAPVPRMALPRAAIRLLPALDWLSHLLLSTPRFATREFVREFAGKEPRFCSDKAKRELDWRPRVFAETVRETVSWIEKELNAEVAGSRRRREHVVEYHPH